MSFLEIISHFSPQYYIFLIFLSILIQLFCWLFQVIAKTSTLAQNSWALTFVMYTDVGFELSPANSIIFFQSTFKSRTVWKTLANRIEFYFNHDNFKIWMGFGQEILETEMKNMYPSKSRLFWKNLHWHWQCCCSAWKMSNFRNEDRSHQVEKACNAEFEKVSKTNFFIKFFG